MVVVAKGVKGQEFIYNPKTAHKVAKANAEKVASALNFCRYDLKNDGEIWHVYEIDQYSIAYDYALLQKFTWGKRGLRRFRNY